MGEQLGFPVLRADPAADHAGRLLDAGVAWWLPRSGRSDSASRPGGRGSAGALRPGWWLPVSWLSRPAAWWRPRRRAAAGWLARSPPWSLWPLPPARLRWLPRLRWPVSARVLWPVRPLRGRCLAWLLGPLRGPLPLPAVVRVLAARPARALILRARPARLLRGPGWLLGRPALPGRAGRLVTGGPLRAGVLTALAWRPLLVPAFGVLSWPAVIVHD
ncbi:hypothetical protein [Amycolatopsis aidingensis]|uniref:hypothetical protein n=1 Tax=Amycolatopsis aidingensis TaxID=2842453 RepID=UPI001C0D6FC0|nr:hypothetical protein [Amycolatopsis aidingensis]